jgi:hypothetical protein
MFATVDSHGVCLLYTARLFRATSDDGLPYRRDVIIPPNASRGAA